MPETATMIIGPAVALVAAARASGLDLAAWLGEQGFDPAQLGDRDARMPVALHHRMWAHALERLGDDLPVRAVAQQSVDTWGVVGCLALTSPDVGTSLERALRYYRAITPVHEWTLEVEEPRARLTFTQPAPAAAEAALAGYHGATEAALAGMLRMFREVSGRELAPLAVRFVHARPRRAEALEAFFGVPLTWGAPAYQLEFARAWLALPTVKAHPSLAAYFEQQAAELVARFRASASVAEAVRAELARRMRGAAPGADDVAQALALSVRTLHRRLREEDTSFQELLDEVRAEMARRYLENDALAVGEVAFLLGFSEPRAFHRAFRRWTGKTPGEWRRARAG